MNKTDYEVAVEEFEKADDAYRELLAKFETGDIILDVSQRGDANSMKRQYMEAKVELERRKDDRNAKLVSAANALRAAVQLAPTQWRGPDGKSTTLKYGPFTVASVTKRSFNAQSLLELAMKKGFSEELLKLSTIDRNGKPYKLVDQKWEIDYQAVFEWLRMHGHEDVIDGAYDEKESTPQVKGPKTCALMGEEFK